MTKKEISDPDVLQVIGDFLEMGQVENILAMFRQEPAYYRLSGHLLRDPRFRVRLGLAVLFEELAADRPAEVRLAVPCLLPLLREEDPRLRGEAANLLGIVGAAEAREQLAALLDDPDLQVVEIVRDILEGLPADPAVRREGSGPVSGLHG